VGCSDFGATAIALSKSTKNNQYVEGKGEYSLPFFVCFPAFPCGTMACASTQATSSSRLRDLMMTTTSSASSSSLAASSSS
jgi:hypothetical protein